jgi:NAD(P)-dependent dehydrogenase (short-subunit alcohol dehydrogenase family)
MRFRDTVALVTGASRGIGRATARRLGAEGARVVVNYGNDAAAAAQVVDEIVADGGQAYAVRADVRDADAVTTMVAAVEARFGSIDVLVNNAGTLVLGDALVLSHAALDEAMRINVLAAAQCVGAVAPAMRLRRRGRIVNVAATSAFGTTAAGVVPHAIAKAGTVLLTKQQALALGPDGITVNAVCFGAIDTELTLPGGRLHEALAPVRKRQVAQTSLRRAGTTAEAAAVIAFLASDDAAFVTGQALSVDGGRTDFLSASG